MTASVTKLPARAPAVAPGLTITSRVNVSQRQQLDISIPVNGEITADQANEMLDLVVAMGERQIARFEIVDYEQALADKQAALALALERREKAKQDYDAQATTFEAEIERLRKAHDEKLEAGAKAHYDSGRQGNFKPAGALQKQLKQYVSAIEMEGAKAFKHRDREQYEQLVEKPHAEIITKFEQEIAAIERVIGRHRAALAD